eukprot:s604_g16.t1
MDALTGNRIDVEVKDKVDFCSWKCIASSGAKVIVHVPETWGHFITKVSSMTLLDFEVSWHEDFLHIHVDPSAKGTILMHPSSSRGQVHLAELFGGLSGWSWAAREGGKDTLLIVEHDEEVAEACAKAHQCEVISAEACLERALRGELTRTTVVRACINDKRVWMSFGLLNVAHAMASPPCQPWSGSGSEQGLECSDGAIFSDLLKWAGRIRLISLMTENVPGICKHADFSKLLAGGSLEGMSLILSGVFSCQRILPVYRDRWLASFCHHSVYIEDSAVQAALQMSLADECFRCPMPGPSLASADADLAQVHEVRGHADNPWNELADQIAKHSMTHHYEHGVAPCHVLKSFAMSPDDLKWAWIQSMKASYAFAMPEMHEAAIWQPSTACCFFKEADTQVEIPSDKATVDFSIVSHNALSLADDKALEHNSARCVRLDAQFHQQKVAILCLQETRTGEGCRTTDHYQIFASGKKICGKAHHLGCEIWLHKTLPFCVPGNGKKIYLCDFKPTVVKATPRCLVIRLCGPFTLTIISAHAPCEAASREWAEVRQWWEDFDLMLGSFATSEWLLCGIDANAPISGPPCEFFGDYGLESSTPTGELFQQVLLNHKLYVPATFEEHVGPTQTWRHPKGNWLRRDYLVVSQCVFHVVDSSSTLQDIDTGFGHVDHVPVKLHIHGLLLAQEVSKRPKWDYEKLKDPACQAKFQDALRTLPMPTWNVGIDSHAKMVEGQIMQLAQQHFAATGTRRKQRPMLRQPTLDLIAFKRQVLQLYRLHDFSACPILKEELKQLDQLIKPKVQADQQAWYDDWLQQIQDSGDIHDHRTLFAKLQRLGRKKKTTGSGMRPLPILQDHDGNIVRTFAACQEVFCEQFSKIEAGIRASEVQLYQLHKPQACANDVDVSLCPSPYELAKIIRKMKNGKAPGPGGLIVEVLKAGGEEITQHLTPLITKAIFHQQEPLHWKSGLLVPLFKGKGKVLFFEGELNDQLLCRAMCKHGILPEDWQQIRGQVEADAALAGVGKHAQNILRDMFSATHFMMAGVPGRTCTTRGTRPRDPVADIIFNMVFYLILRDTRDQFQQITGLPWLGCPQPPRDITCSAPLPSDGFCDISFVDDVAYCVHTDTPAALSPALQCLASCLHDVARLRGLNLNYNKGKTEVMMHYAGPGSRKVRSQIWHQQHATLPVVTEKGTSFLHVVHEYKHLGSFVQDYAVNTKDARLRVAQAKQAVAQLQRSFFGKRNISTSTKTTVFRALVTSRHTFQAHTWSWVTAKEIAQWNSGLRNSISLLVKDIIRPIPAFHFSTEHLYALAGLNAPEDLLHANRLRYLSRMITTAPAFLWQLLHRTNEAQAWPALALQSYTWLRKYSPRVLPRPDSFSELCSFISMYSRLPGVIKSALKSCQSFHAAEAKGLLWLRQIERFVHSWSEEDSKVEVACTKHWQCASCDKSFDSKRALAMRARQAHQYRKWQKYYALDVDCLACGKRYFARSRFIAHLTTSHECARIYKACLPPAPEAIVEQIEEEEREIARALKSQGWHTSKAFLPVLKIPFAPLPPAHSEEATLMRSRWSARNGEQGEAFNNLEGYATHDHIDQTDDDHIVPFLGQTFGGKIAGHGGVFQMAGLSSLHAQVYIKSFVFVHFYSGFRRMGDLQWQIENFQVIENVHVFCLSIDLCLAKDHSDLTSADTKAFWLKQIRLGNLLGLGGGGPRAKPGLQHDYWKGAPPSQASRFPLGSSSAFAKASSSS